MSGERILVIRLTALGDVVLVEPVIRALRRRFPGAVVDLLTEVRFLPLGASFFSVDALLGYDRRGRDRGLRGLNGVVERLSSRAYTLVVDLQNKLRTRFLTARLPAARRVVLKKRTALAGIGTLVGHDPPIADRHTVDIYLAALEPIGVPPPDPRAAEWPRAGRPEPLLPGGSGSPGDLADKVRGGPLIGLAPGATHPTKHWPAERFGALADQLSGRLPGVRFLMIGGAADRPLAARVRATAPASTFVDFDVLALDVGGLARAIASLDLLVSVDTGPAHLAQAIGVRCVVLFGPTAPRRWGPRGPEHRSVSLELACAPCSNVGGPRCPLPGHSHDCMRGLGVDQVRSAVLQVLGGVA